MSYCPTLRGSQSACPVDPAHPVNGPGEPFGVPVEVRACVPSPTPPATIHAEQTARGPAHHGGREPGPCSWCHPRHMTTGRTVLPTLHRGVSIFVQIPGQGARHTPRPQVPLARAPQQTTTLFVPSPLPSGPVRQQRDQVRGCPPPAIDHHAPPPVPVVRGHPAPAAVGQDISRQPSLRPHSP